MDFLIFGIAALSLILAKALLTRQERDLRNKRGQRKIKQLQEDAARGASMEQFKEDRMKNPTPRPPPLPTEEGS